MTLRPLTLHDAEDFFHTSNSDDIGHFLPGFYCNNVDKAREVITKLTTDSQIKTFVIGTVSNDFTGIIVIVEKGPKEIEISSFVGEMFRGQGLASQALEEVIYMYPGYKICFQVEDYNTNSVRIMNKFHATKGGSYYYYIYA